MRGVVVALAALTVIASMMGNAPQNCGFSTLEQCRMTVAGIGGTCEFNPFYATSPPGAAPPTSRRLRSRGG